MKLIFFPYSIDTQRITYNSQEEEWGQVLTFDRIRSIGFTEPFLTAERKKLRPLKLGVVPSQ